MARKTIGGNIFNVEPLPAMRSFLLQPLLAPIIAEVGAGLAGIIGTVDFGDVEEAGADGVKVSRKRTLKDLGALADGGLEDFLALDIKINPRDISQSVIRVCTQMPPAILDKVMRELLAGATMTDPVSGKSLMLFNLTPGGGEPFDVLMRGRTLDAWKLLYFAVQVSYPDVFSPSVAAGVASLAGQNSET